MNHLPLFCCQVPLYRSSERLFLVKVIIFLGAFFAAAFAAAQTNLPGRMQAESYTSMSGVQLENTSDSGGGQNVGWIDTNDWMTYSINPSAAGWYDVRYRVASAASGGRVVLGHDGQDLNTDSEIPNTGGWQSWVTVSSSVYLNAGPQTITVFARNGGWNINWIEFTRQQTALPKLRQSGRFWVDTSGNRVNLRGTNVGNWLQLEFWMMNESVRTNAGIVHDQCTLEDTLSGRFGHSEKERLMKVFRDNWITTRDWDHMQAMGMNVVRIPFMYNLIEDENNPYNLRADAWQYLDYAIDEAERRGMYTILDLHGAVGSQGWEHHSGCANKNELWGSAHYRDRTKWLWDKIAERYRGRSAVAGYGLLNEPWGTDPSTLADFSTELYHVARAKDPDTMIILPGHNTGDGIGAYGHPANRGMSSNVAFEMHFYPGLWGWNEGTGTAHHINVHNNWLHCNLNGTGETCDWNNRMINLNTPLLVGEFQPWTLLGAAGGQMLRKTYDIYNMYGWAATNWAYKTVSFNGSNGSANAWGWGMVSNSSNGGTFGTLNVSTATVQQIENYFRAFAAQALVRNPEITQWMNYRPTVGQRIEAQHFSSHSGARIETTSDAGGGFNVGNLDDNDWMLYPINIPQSGWYNLQYRVASAYAGGQLVLSRDGNDLVVNSIPNTGGWQNWVTITNSVYLTAGQQDLSIYVRTGGWNINWWMLTPQ
jgi:hypothetical protein